MEQPNSFEAFCAKLNTLRENAGAMADLRCALIPAREQRAWPYIVEFFPLENERKRQIALTVAGAFGIQPEPADSKSNMGDVIKAIALGTDKKQDGLKTFATRFQRILNCATPGELIPFLRGIFNTAKTRGIPINHLELLKDLTYWGEEVKIRWASHYYYENKKQEEKNV